jgi:hypothetical protein
MSVDVPVGCKAILTNPLKPNRHKTIGSGHWDIIL